MSHLAWELLRALQFVSVGLATESLMKQQLFAMGLIERKGRLGWALTAQGKEVLADMHKPSGRRKRRPDKG